MLDLLGVYLEPRRLKNYQRPFQLLKTDGAKAFVIERLEL